MNKLHKFFGLAAALLFSGSLCAQPAQPTPPEESMPTAMQACPMGGNSIDFQSVRTCYVPAMRAFVVIDSTDCAVDFVVREQDSLRLVGRYVTDSLYKRHDLQNILRPVSVGFRDGKIVFVAASAKDSSYVGVLDVEAQDGVLPLLARVGLSCKSYAFSISPCGKELTVVGKNPQGYNFNIFDLSEGLDKIAADKVQSFGYKVPKQSERIQQSDPVGVGLTVVAVVVVFFCLLIIALILMGYGNVIMKVQDKRSKKAVAKAASAGKGEAIPANDSHTAGDVYAAIAAAIYMYNEELHDEEDTILTIQKVERAWTPWNAKFYNMNQYFNRSK